MPESRIADLHVYLPEPERSGIIAWAESEDRTASNLVKLIIRQAPAARAADMPADSRRAQTAKQQRHPKG